jgi:hypothetical protein
MRAPVAACLRWCVSGECPARESVAEASLVDVAPQLTARLLSRTGAPACTEPPSLGMRGGADSATARRRRVPGLARNRVGVLQA